MRGDSGFKLFDPRNATGAAEAMQDRAYYGDEEPISLAAAAVRARESGDGSLQSINHYVNEQRAGLQSTIADGLDQLNTVLGEVHQLVGLLGGKLSPVLRGEDVKPSTCSAAMASGCEVGSRISQAVYEVRSIQRRLEELIDRTDL